MAPQQCSPAAVHRVAVLQPQSRNRLQRGRDALSRRAPARRPPPWRLRRPRRLRLLHGAAHPRRSPARRRDGRRSRRKVASRLPPEAAAGLRGRDRAALARACRARRGRGEGLARRRRRRARGSRVRRPRRRAVAHQPARRLRTAGRGASRCSRDRPRRRARCPRSCGPTVSRRARSFAARPSSASRRPGAPPWDWRSTSARPMSSGFSSI